MNIHLCMLVIAAIAMGVFLAHTWREGTLSFEALVADGEAYRRLFDWREANPNVPLGESQTGRRLLTEYIRAYDRFVRYHPFLKDTEERRAYLLSLFDEVGPPPPGKSKRPPTLKRLAHASRSLYIRAYLPKWDSFAIITRWH